MTRGEELHLILTSLHELDFALIHRWPIAVEVVAAIRDGDYQILFEDDIGAQALARLRSEASRPEVVYG